MEEGHRGAGGIAVEELALVVDAVVSETLRRTARLPLLLLGLLNLIFILQPRRRIMQTSTEATMYRPAPLSADPNNRSRVLRIADHRPPLRSPLRTDLARPLRLLHPKSQ